MCIRLIISFNTLPHIGTVDKDCIRFGHLCVFHNQFGRYNQRNLITVMGLQEYYFRTCSLTTTSEAGGELQLAIICLPLVFLRKMIR